MDAKGVEEVPTSFVRLDYQGFEPGGLFSAMSPSQKRPTNSANSGVN